MLSCLTLLDLRPGSGFLSLSSATIWRKTRLYESIDAQIAYGLAIVGEWRYIPIRTPISVGRSLFLDPLGTYSRVLDVASIIVVLKTH